VCAMHSSYVGVGPCICILDLSGGVTIPSTVADEKLTNPFMRVHHASVAAYTQVRYGLFQFIAAYVPRRLRATVVYFFVPLETARIRALGWLLNWLLYTREF